MKKILCSLIAAVFLGLGSVGAQAQEADANTLYYFLIWVPLDGMVEGSVRADYIQKVYVTGASCVAARDNDSQVMWTKKPGHRMLGTKECTDGSMPTSVVIGSFNVTVNNIDPTPTPDPTPNPNPDTGG